MLEEISESAAKGHIAEIYAQIRTSCAVPYVSSLQRFLATKPEWLSWCWDALGPGFRAGWIPAAGWRASNDLTVPRLATIPDSALRVWNAQALIEINNICDNFIRVSPTNLMFSGIARRLLLGHRPSGGALPQALTAPEVLPDMPALIAFETLAPEVRSLLIDHLGTEVDGKPFVPALYRLFAPWPGFLAHFATVLRPLFDDSEVINACQRLSTAIEQEIDNIWPAVSDPGPAFQPPDHPETQTLIAAIDRYRVTSPQMVVFSTMLRNALPD